MKRLAWVWVGLGILTGCVAAASRSEPGGSGSMDLQPWQTSPTSMDALGSTTEDDALFGPQAASTGPVAVTPAAPSCSDAPFYDPTRYDSMAGFDRMPVYVDDMSAHRGCCNTDLSYPAHSLPSYPCAAKLYEGIEDVNKPVVLLIHGNSDGPTTFEEFEDTGAMLSERLALSGYRTYAVDMRFTRVDDPTDEDVGNPARNMDHSWGVPIVQRFIRAALGAHPNRQFAIIAHSFGVTAAREALRRLQVEGFDAWPQLNHIIYASGGNHGVSSCAACGVNPSMKGHVTCQMGCRDNFTPTAFLQQLNGPGGLYETPCGPGGSAFGDAEACKGHTVHYTTITMQDLDDGTQQDLFVSEASSALLGADNRLIGLNDFDVTGYFVDGLLRNHFGSVRSEAGMNIVMEKLQR